MTIITDSEIEGYYKRYKANKRKLEIICNPKITTKLTFLPMFHSGESKTETVATSKVDLEREINIVEMCNCKEVMKPIEMDWISWRYFEDKDWEDITGILHESISTLKRIRKDVIRKTKEMIMLSKEKASQG